MNPQQIYPPEAWHLDPAHVAQAAEHGWHCETRGCREPAAIVTQRWFWSASAHRVMVAEHFTCGAHGEAFARRHHIAVEPEDAPAARVS